MKLTPQQENFIEAAKDPNQSLALNAVAGSGKTSTIQQASVVMTGTGIASSFSRSTVTELAKKLPSKFPAKTMHSIGLDTIKSSAKTKITVDKSGEKLYSFIKNEIEEYEESWQLISPIRDLVEKAQLHGIVPNHHRFLIEDSYENWEAIADQYDIQFSEFILDIARKTLSHSIEQIQKEGIITFNDMLYYPVFFPHRFSLSKTLIIDEAQDLSPLQHEILSRSLMQGGRVICAGDPCQAIYSFAGAMNDSYSKLVSRFNCTEMPLTVSFRCPKAVVREAQRYVPHIEAAPNATEGDVIWHDELSLSELPRQVLCRNNAPLISLALRLLSNGYSADVAGKDIGKGLISLTKRLASGKNSDSMPVEQFFDRLKNWADNEVKKKPRSKGKVFDKVASLQAMCTAHKNLGQVRRQLESLFVNPDGEKKPAEFQLSTIHRAKGREWPHVLFLDPELIPSPWVDQEWELQQERNLAYVSITRAQEVLHYINSKDIV